jgi:hypothetical protein
MVREYGQDGKRIKATAIAEVTQRGTHTRVLHLASGWDLNLSVVVDGCEYTLPKDLLLVVQGRRGINDLVEMLEWYTAVLRDELSEGRMEQDAATWEVADEDKPWLRLVEPPDDAAE